MFSIDECHTGDHIGQQLGGRQRLPVRGGRLAQFEDHRQAGHTAAVAFGAEVAPVFGREIVERERRVVYALPRVIIRTKNGARRE